MTRPTPHELRVLKHKLLAQRSALLRSAHDDLARWSQHPMRELAGEVPDSGDQSVAALLTDVDHSALQLHVKAIRDIDTALSRIRGRRYSICVDCGLDIGVDRLAASPTAQRCVACQRRREKTFADGAGVTL